MTFEGLRELTRALLGPPRSDEFDALLAKLEAAERRKGGKR